MPKITHLFSEAHFIHIIRDGRDAATSLRDLWFSPSRDYGDLAKYWAWRVRTIRELGTGRGNYMEIRYEDLIRDTRRILGQVCHFLELDWSDTLLRYYERSSDRLQEHEGGATPDGTTVVTKEQRIAQQRLVQFPPDQSRIGAWRNTMHPDDVEKFLQEAGSLLDELGYRTP